MFDGNKRAGDAKKGNVEIASQISRTNSKSTEDKLCYRSVILTRQCLASKMSHCGTNAQPTPLKLHHYERKYSKNISITGMNSWHEGIAGMKE